MCKHGGTSSQRDKHVTPAAISPAGVARGRFVGGQQSGLAGCKPPPLFTRGASSCSSQGRRQGEPWGAPPRPRAPTYLPTLACNDFPVNDLKLAHNHVICLACVSMHFPCVVRSSEIVVNLPPCEINVGTTTTQKPLM